MSTETPEERERKRLERAEWLKREALAHEFARTLAPHELEVARSKASDSATRHTGYARPSHAVAHAQGPWCFTLGNEERQAINEWDSRWAYYFVREVERLREFKAAQPTTYAAASEGWQEGRE